ncbi:MAG: S9 family peptidase, partial [Acidobacteria bacterium]|nr:S9 family peptidase [Acidobacteriota bacterium]
MRALFAALLLAVSLPAQKPFDAAALMRLARISDPQLSPDGRLVAFTAMSVDVEANKRTTSIWVVELGGGTPRKIASAGEHNERPSWSPDSKRIAFVSDRGGSSQLWLMDADGGNPKQVTDLATEASGVLFSPDGKHLVFTSEVYPDCPDMACNKSRLEAEKAGKVKARSYDTLLYRHWTTWQNPRRSHIFAIPVEGGPARDLTPGAAGAPPFSLGGPDDYAISPDGTEVAFIMNVDAVQAVSTNSDLYAVPVAGGPYRKITTNPAADNSPAYSPDGKYIAYRAQTKPGYESDRWRLMVLERATGKVANLTENLDRWISSFTWSPDSSKLFFTVEDRGRQSIHFIPVEGGATRVAISGDSQLDDMRFTPDGKTMVYSGQTAGNPVEIYRASSAGGAAVPLTRLNDAVLAEHAAAPVEELWVEAADKTRIHSLLVKPSGFDAGRKYPLLLLIHGGPQGAWGYSWTYRWNAQVF